MRLGSPEKLRDCLHKRFAGRVHVDIAYGEVTARMHPAELVDVATVLRDDADLAFAQLIDICGLDNQEYGVSEWETSATATRTSFSRGVDSKVGARSHFQGGDRSEALDQADSAPSSNPEYSLSDKAHRLWGVYHLLSHQHNWRLRLKVPASLNQGLYLLDSVVSLWKSADWYEREAFDLYGIHFNNHPDLRRLLTDYGFIGHPMRKDFPLVGEVEVSYDSQQQRVVYQPVSIEPRVLVPKVIRPDTAPAKTKEPGQ